MAKSRPTLTAFLDSSVLFTAVNSPTGGSAKLFTYSNLDLVVSPVVLAETERNVRSKLETYHLKRFFTLIKHLTLIDSTPNPVAIAKAQAVIVQKDAVILAEAKQANSDYLVTLDQKHFFTQKVITYLTPTKVVTPKQLILQLSL